MSLTNEDLLAISNIVQSQVDPLKNDIRDIKLTLKNDIDIMKKVLIEHSEKLQKTS